MHMEATVRLHIDRNLALSKYFSVTHTLKRVRIWKKIACVYSQEENAVR